MKKVIMIIIVIIISGNILGAQECGPFCPVCSGSSDGSLLAPGSFLFTSMYIPNGDEEKGLMNLRYGVFSWLDLGIGYSIKAKKIIWNARAQVLKEDEKGWLPGIILGTGSVQTGGSDQSIYINLTKSWEFSESFAMRITTGIASLVPELSKTYGIFGVTLSIAEKFSIFTNFDGINFHEGISWILTDWISISALLIESKNLAVSVGIKWNSPKK